MGADSAERVAVVTGAASGIGRATAEVLAGAGFAVVAVDRNERALAEVVNASPGLLAPVVGDVSDPHTHARAVSAASGLGGLKAWVNNAGVDLRGSAHEVSAEEIEYGIRVLQLGAMFGCSTAVREMMTAHGGAIVNVSSIQGVVSFPRYFVYGAAKAALLMVTKSIAVDYAPYGIRCNAVLPGTVDTPMLDPLLPPGITRAAALAEEGKLSPSGRIAEPLEVASVIAFLLSDAASYVSGDAIRVDGASTARCYPYDH